MSERKAVSKGKPPISVSRQCQLLAGPRSSVSTRSRGVSDADGELRRQLHELYLTWPFSGSRRLCEEVQQRSYPVNRKRVSRLMRQMGLRAVYPKPRTRQPATAHKIFPSRLKGPAIGWSSLGITDRLKKTSDDTSR